MTLDLSYLSTVGDRFHNALTLVDLAGPDQPLVYVNGAFVELTGYERAAILGRNCRFLQGSGTDPADVARIGGAIRDRRAVFCDLLNYRKDGRQFFNRLVLLPLELQDHPYFIGMQIDATPLLAREQSEGRPFDELKTSEEIRDRINTPLMNIAAALTLADPGDARERILNRAFSQILDTVRSLPFRGSRAT